MSPNKKNNTDEIVPPPGMHLEEKWEERICKGGYIYIQTWVTFCCPSTDPIMINEVKTEDKC